MKERVDKLLVEQSLTIKGLTISRNQAQALVMAGQVCVGDQLVRKSSEIFPSDTVFRLKEGALSPYVSRGGEKLAGALKRTGLNVMGYRGVDIGISTGGFTDCLLQSGAASVIGVDVGHNQLAWKIKNDPRVTSYEGINARALPMELFPHEIDLVVIDVSFISLAHILPEAQKILKLGGALLALIKPQFEVERGQVGKRGIVKDPLLHRQVQEKIGKVCATLGFKEIQNFESPIEGKDGNKEFFIFARR